MERPAFESARAVLDSVKAPDARKAAQTFVARTGRNAWTASWQAPSR